MNPPSPDRACTSGLRALRSPVGIAAAVCGPWLLLAYAILLDANPAYLWHVALFGLSALLVWKPSLILPRAGIRARPVHFILIAIVWSSLIAMPLATLLQGDLHPNMLVNAFLWLGGMVAIAMTWLGLLRRYRWGTIAIFVVSGLLALVEPVHALVQLARSGQWGAFAILLPVLHATHACLLAPIANAYRNVLARPAASPPGWKGYALAAVLYPAAFLLGTAGWFWIVQKVFGALGK